MALIRCNFFSEVLQLSTSMTVILPEPAEGQIGLAGATTLALPPVLYLLHGLSDDETIWVRRTSIERYVAPLGLAVVMPQVHRSFYQDEVHGGRYWTFVSQELPAVVQRFFRVSDRREDTFVAGLSMGGYGALQWALREPDRFCAAASLSGALDVESLRRAGDRRDVMDRAFGEGPLTGTDADLMTLLCAAAARGSLPALFVCCGLQDRLADDNRRFLQHADELRVEVTSMLDDGDHEWGYWDSHIQDVLAWLPLPARPGV